MDDRTQAIRDAVIVLQARFDLLDRQVQQNGLTAQDIRERQAAIRNDIEHLKAMANQGVPSGFIERFMAVMLGANKWHILAIAGVILFFILLIFFPDGIVKIIEALRAVPGPV